MLIYIVDRTNGAIKPNYWADMFYLFYRHDTHFNPGGGGVGEGHSLKIGCDRIDPSFRPALTECPLFIVHIFLT